jgi:hypothetical protein
MDRRGEERRGEERRGKPQRSARISDSAIVT